MNKVVYDSMDNELFKAQEESKEPDALTNSENGIKASIPTPQNCDNDQDFESYYKLKTPDDTTLVFESRFESANLRKAIQIYENEYDLLLKPDYLTKGNNQWFYFRAHNTRAGKTYRFNIINLLKPDSLYNHGMKPLFYSEINAERFNTGWVRCGENVCYF